MKSTQIHFKIFNDKKISYLKSTNFDISICFGACFISNQKKWVKISFSVNCTITFAFTYEEK